MIISLLFDAEPCLTNPTHVKYASSEVTINSIPIEVFGECNHATGVVRIKLTWTKRGEVFTDDNLSYLKFMSSDLVKKDIVRYVRKLLKQPT